MRIALIWVNPDGPVGVNHGVLILARELADAGHDVQVHHLQDPPRPDGGLPPTLTALVEQAPALVGLSFTSPYAAIAEQLCSAVKAALPHCHLLCGGIHATLDPDGVLAWPGVDGVGLGELDGGPLTRYVGRLGVGERPTDEPGFWVREGDRVHRNPLAPLPDLTEQVLPDYGLVDTEALVRAKRGFGEVLSGRGCPYRCRFCQNHALVERYRESYGTPASQWPYVRQRSADNVLAELAELRRRAPSMKAVMFADDRLAGDARWLAEFGARYRQEVGLPFIVNATPEQIDAEVATLLADAGCNMVKLGVECAPGPLRRQVLGRPFDGARVEAAFAHLQAAGINTMAYLMVGIPGETPADLAETFRFTAALRPDCVRVSMFCPYPGTRLHADLVAKGRLAPDAASRGFDDPSVLSWPPEMALRLNQALRVHPWRLGQHLDPVPPGVAELVAWIEALDAAAWEASETQTELAVRETVLRQDLATQDAPYYEAVFAERSDYAFLRRDRTRPLINVD